MCLNYSGHQDRLPGDLQFTLTGRGPLVSFPDSIPFFLAENRSIIQIFILQAAEARVEAVNKVDEPHLTGLSAVSARVQKN